MLSTASIPLAFIAGLFGSVHCIGMCGPFVLAIGSGARNNTSALLRQLAYTGGRIAMYATIGAFAGLVGEALQKQSPAVLRLPAVLSVLAGGLLVWQGIKLLSGKRENKLSNGAACLTESFFNPIARARSFGQSFVAGVLTGLLPCGLLYGMVALVAASGEMLTGAGTLAAFAAGTAPPLIALGWSARLFAHWQSPARARMFQAVGVLLLLAGGLSVARGVQYWRSFATPESPACPFCAKH
jgi:sulfite exporter TauE/SafE